tara:strand:+ start:34 stop:600 length:567 start_codon:yes stop_codon:yes gene_type:complete
MNDLNDESKLNKEKENQEDKLPIEDQLKNSEDKLLRSLAEIENQRNRFEKEIKEAIDFGSFNFARESLAILDNLRRAYNSIKDDESFKNNKDLNKFLKNIEIIEKDILSIFKKNKIEKIDTNKKKFDPNFHQAMTEIEDDKVEPGKIIQEIQAGYMYGDRLLRPSLVAVSKKIEQKDQEIREKSEKKS